VQEKYRRADARRPIRRGQARRVRSVRDLRRRREREARAGAGGARRDGRGRKRVRATYF